MKLFLALIALSLGTAASAATITSASGPGKGTELALDLGDFTGLRAMRRRQQRHQ